MTNSNGISNSFQFNYKLQSVLRIISNWITKVINNADPCAMLITYGILIEKVSQMMKRKGENMQALTLHA